MRKPKARHFAGLLAAAFLSALAPTTASAQVMYGGYNLGPNYGAMIQQQTQIQQQQNARMEQMSQQVAAQAMQDPVCVEYYRQHRTQGGQMTPLQFGYECARQGRFTPGGQAFAAQADRENQARENATLRGLRQAEAQRGEAQQDYAAGFQRNNAEFGNYLQGRNTYVDPRNGQQQVLQHTQPGQPTYDPRTGQTYVMNNMGQYFVRAPDGAWYPIQQSR